MGVASNGATWQWRTAGRQELVSFSSSLSSAAAFSSGVPFGGCVQPMQLALRARHPNSSHQSPWPFVCSPYLGARAALLLSTIHITRPAGTCPRLPDLPPHASFSCRPSFFHISLHAHSSSCVLALERLPCCLHSQQTPPNRPSLAASMRQTSWFRTSLTLPLVLLSPLHVTADIHYHDKDPGLFSYVTVRMPGTCALSCAPVLTVFPGS